MEFDTHLQLAYFLEETRGKMTKNGIYCPVSDDAEPIPLRMLILDAQSASEPKDVDALYKSFRELEQKMISTLQKNPSYQSYQKIAEDVLQVSKVTRKLRQNIVSRIRLCSKWAQGSISPEKDLYFVGFRDLAFSYKSLSFDERTGSFEHEYLPSRLSVDEIAQSLEGNAVYEIVHMPSICFRTGADRAIMMAQKWACVKREAQKQGKYPFWIPTELVQG